MNQGDHDGLSTVRRQTARSGLVDYGPPVAVHETGRSKLEFVPYYIPHHNEPPRLAGFLQRSERDAQTGAWSDPVRVVTFGEEDITRLLRALEEHAAVAQR